MRGLSTLVAELLGTFFFVLSIFASAGNPYIVGAALALVLLLVGGMSGGFANPAVAFAMFLKGAISNMEMFYYIAAQLAGAAGAVYAFRAVQ